jgi:hypothetical protein
MHLKKIASKKNRRWKTAVIKPIVLKTFRGVFDIRFMGRSRNTATGQMPGLEH